MTKNGRDGKDSWTSRSTCILTPVSSDLGVDTRGFLRIASVLDLSKVQIREAECSLLGLDVQD